MKNQRVRIFFRMMNRPAGDEASWESVRRGCLETVGEYYQRGDAHYCLFV